VCRRANGFGMICIPDSFWLVLRKFHDKEAYLQSTGGDRFISVPIEHTKDISRFVFTRQRPDPRLLEFVARLQSLFGNDIEKANFISSFP